MKKLPIGISDFKLLRKSECYYIDKSLLADEILESSGQVILLPRPRRFGKTMNLSMLHYFFERQGAEENKVLFDGLAIQKTATWTYQGQHSVVFISFKDVKSGTISKTFEGIQKLVADEFKRHDYLLNSPSLSDNEKAFFNSTIQGQASEIDLERSLKSLCKFLEKHHQQKVVLLLDEYDTPVHAAYSNGFFDEFMDFYRNFLSAGLKDNEHLLKGVVTGILRVAKESIFSGLNNPIIATVLDERFSDKFGLTQTEVEQLLSDYDMEDKVEGVRHWYNGYIFGENIIYNPWSLLNFVAEKAKSYKIYWVNTAQNTLIKDQMRFASVQVKKDFEQMMNGKPVLHTLQEHTSFDDLKAFRADALYCLLVFSGYLKAKFIEQKGRKRYFELSIPNEEVKTLYEDFMADWLGAGLSTERVNYLLEFLLEGEVEDFQLLLSEYVETAFSYFDLPKEISTKQEPEKLYHSFILGLLAQLSTTHDVRSNRESGFGRADVMIFPKDENDQRGYVLELKTVAKHKGEDLDIAIENALKQIDDKNYVSELKARKKTDIFKWALSFDGKETKVKLVREKA